MCAEFENRGTVSIDMQVADFSYCKHILVLLKTNVVAFSGDKETVIVIVICTSSSTTPEHCNDIANVSVDFGMIPELEMFSVGDGKAASFEVSVLIVYGNQKKKTY